MGVGNTTVIVLKFIIRYIADDEESFPFFLLSHLLISSSWFSSPGKLRSVESGIILLYTCVLN